MNNIVLEVADVVEDEVIVCPSFQCRPMCVLSNVEDGMANTSVNGEYLHDTWRSLKAMVPGCWSLVGRNSS
jgi:hypothetical protein